MINKKNVKNLNSFENSVKKRHNLSLDTQISQSDNENKEFDTDYEGRELNLLLARGGCKQPYFLKNKKESISQSSTTSSESIWEVISLSPVSDDDHTGPHTSKYIRYL